MAISIILADTDEEYLSRLESYIQTKGDNTYHTIKFSDKAELQEAVSKGKYDVLLFSPEMYDKNLNLKKVKVAIAIFDDDDLTSETFKRSINKYTKITSLLEYITFEYEQAEKNKPVVYGVYSPAGGVGKTTIALSLVISNIKLGKKTLYINAEDFDSTPLFFEQESPMITEAATLEDIERLGRIGSFIQTDSKTGIMYFNNIKEFNTHDATYEQLSYLVQSVIDDEVANVIVIDLNSALDDFNKSIFQIVDQLILVAGTGQSNFKLNCFLENRAVIEPIKSKLRIVVNQEKNFDIETDLQIVGKIDTLYSAKPLANPLALSSYIAGKDFIKLA